MEDIYCRIVETKKILAILYKIIEKFLKFNVHIEYKIIGPRNILSIFFNEL